MMGRGRVWGGGGTEIWMVTPHRQRKSFNREHNIRQKRNQTYITGACRNNKARKTKNRNRNCSMWVLRIRVERARKRME